jgi:farnesol dehydrogenase
MKILVTGATGFVGTNLTQKLTKNGHEVHAFCRSKPDEQLNSNSRVKIFRGDIVERESLFKAMEGCTQVFHVCAYTRTLAKNVADYYKVNVGGTINVMESAMKLGVQKVVYTSAGGVFGPSTDMPLDEDSFRVCSFFNDHETSKFMAEEKIKDYVLDGLNVVIVNPCRIYGPGFLSKTNALSQIILSYMTGKWHMMPGSGKTVMNYAFIEDIVNGHIKAMENGKAGQRYILGGSNASYVEFFDTINKNLNKRHFLFKIPFRIIKMYANIEVFYSRLLNKEPDITPKWVKSFRYNMARTSEKAIRELDYSITPLDEGVRKTIEWLKIRDQ